MEQMQQRVDDSSAGLEKSIARQDGLTLWGRSAFAGQADDRFELTAGDQTLRAARVFINTGTRALSPPLPGIDNVPHLDNGSRK